MLRFAPYTQPSEFLTLAESCLGHAEAKYNLMLGLARRLATRPRSNENQPWLAAIFDGGELKLLLLQTDAQHPLQVVGSLSEASLEILKAQLNAREMPFQNLLAETELAWQFARYWADVKGLTIQQQKHLGVYELREVVWCPEVVGQLRQATSDELDTLCQWTHAFMLDALPEEAGMGPEDYQESTSRGIEAGDFYVWERQGQILSMCAINRRMSRGVCISLVYTPPGLRGQGLASACVAKLSQEMLNQGQTYCALHTDLTNPISNRIYQRIGYQQVGEFVNLRFEKPGI